MKYVKLYDGNIIYHFCAGRFLDGIKKKGIRLGKIPSATSTYIKLIPGYQWVTTNPDFVQSWAEHSSIPYDRTEYRITILLPNVEKFNLFKWTDFGKDNPLFDQLNSFGDAENWYVFKGVIIPYWFQKIERKP